MGRILLGHANEVLAQLERAGADIAAYTTGTAGEVKVASFATAIGLVVAPAVSALREKEPGIQVRVLDAEGDQSLTMVLDGEVDVAVAVEYRGAPAEDDRRLSRIPLYAEPFDVVLPRGHRLAGAPLRAGERRIRWTPEPYGIGDDRPVPGPAGAPLMRSRSPSRTWRARRGSAPTRATPATT
nr:hypothetical protein GCM10020093_065750 [Planobispora longispora]